MASVAFGELLCRLAAVDRLLVKTVVGRDGHFDLGMPYVHLGRSRLLLFGESKMTVGRLIS